MTDQTSRNLSVLLQAVSAARSEVEEARRLRASPGSATVAAEQRVLLDALEQYAEELSHRGSPMPYRLRDELAMYRAMFSTRRQR